MCSHYYRMAELSRVERLMADVSALLLNVIDAKDLGITGGRRHSGGGSGRGSGRGSFEDSSRNLTVQVGSNTTEAGDTTTSTSASFARSHSFGASEQLGPLARLLLPAVAALGRWWGARSKWSASEAELNHPQLYVEHMAQVNDTPHSRVCKAPLVLHAWYRSGICLDPRDVCTAVLM